MYNLLIGLEVIAIAMTLVAQGMLVNSNGSKEQRFMSLFLSGAMIHNIGYLLEITAPGLEAAMVAAKMQFIGIAFVPIFYCWFIFHYCHVKVPVKLMQALLLADALLLIPVLTCERHSFFYRSVRWLTDESGHSYLNAAYGIGFVLFLAITCVVPYLLSFCALAYAILVRANKLPGKRYKLINLLAVFPVLALFAYIFKWYQAYDFTPAVVGVVLSLVVILVWRRRNYDFGRLAAEVVLRNMEDGVIMLDSDKRIVNYNPSAADIFTELSFQTVGDSIEDMEDFPAYLLDENMKRNFKLNNRHYEGHVKRIVDRAGQSQGYVVIVFDVTETRNYIEEIKRVREQAERANQAKSEFLANMSHEIRTPMNAVVGLSDIIMEHSRGRKVYGYACDIKAASQNLLAIINDILDLSKVESGKMELVPEDYYIKGVIREVVNMMKVAASQRGLELKYEYAADIPCRYHGDEGRIKQILINIMNNAVKFTKKGFIKISVDGYPAEDSETENLVFRIQDTGIGIKQENLEKIFEDFKQVDSGRNRGVEGTGLGLSITKRFIQLMKGSIEVESVYGEGSTFIVTIPQKIVDSRTLEEVPEVPGKESENLESFMVENYKVLVVDDNLINRKVASGFLQNYGFDLYEAESGREAIEMVKNTKFNIIFMDHMMPEMDGVEATRIIREECGENGRVPIVIALTANAMSGVREKFLNSGFQDFIAKPLDRKPLNELLSRWIPDAYKQIVGQEEDGEAGMLSEIDFDDIHVSGIDVAEAQKHHTGGVDDYIDLLRLYYLDGKRKGSLIKELAEQENYGDYRIEVHGLKSASANVGAMELSAQAREHEEAAIRGDIDFIKMHSSELLACYDRQIEAIKQFLDQRQAVNDALEDSESPSLELDALKRQLNEALEKLENFKSKECAHIIEDLLKYRLDGRDTARLKEIQDQLRMYEDDEAEKLLREMVEWLEKEER